MKIIIKSPVGVKITWAANPKSSPMASWRLAPNTLSISSMTKLASSKHSPKSILYKINKLM